MKGTDENHSVKYMNIGLVLSGGMAKGAYQIGVLRAISEYIPISEIKYISCESIGVFNGYALLTLWIIRRQRATIVGDLKMEI